MYLLSHLPIHTSTCHMSVYLSTHPHVHPFPIHLYSPLLHVHSSICQYVYSFIYSFICPPLLPSLHPPTHSPPTHPLICVSAHPFMYPLSILIYSSTTHPLTICPPIIGPLATYLPTQPRFTQHDLCPGLRLGRFVERPDKVLPSTTQSVSKMPPVLSSDVYFTGVQASFLGCPQLKSEI